MSLTATATGNRMPPSTVLDTLQELARKDVDDLMRDETVPDWVGR